MIKIAFVYSKYHFLPDGPETPLVLTGAGYLAKEIFSLFHQLYPDSSVDYYDHSEWRQLKRRNRVDLLFGIGSNLSRFRDVLLPKETILFAVNRAGPTRHALSQQIEPEADVRHLPLSGHDGTGANRSELDAADKVLQLGSWGNYYANLVCGVKPQNQELVSFRKLAGVNQNHLKASPAENQKNVLFLAGSAILRKGLHVVLPLLKELEGSRSSFKLVLVGQSAHPAITAFLQNALRGYPNNFLWIDRFISPNSPEWIDLFESSVLAIAPSLEEGQQDAAMECVARGVPLLHSGEVGFESLTTNALVSNESSSFWVDTIMAVLGNKNLRDRILESQQMLYGLQAPGVSHIKEVLATHKASNWSYLSCVSAPLISKSIQPGDFLTLFDSNKFMMDYAQEYLRLRYPKLRAKLVPLGEHAETKGVPKNLGSDADFDELFFSIGGWKEWALTPSFRVWNEADRFLNLAVSAFRQRIAKI
jgi:DNA-binding transcriptional LysR family regulator